MVGAADHARAGRSRRPATRSAAAADRRARPRGFLLDLAEQRVAGAFNGTAPIGQTTMGELLEAAGDAELRWIADEELEAAGVEPWTELPLWLPGALRGDVARRHERAQAAGLRCRPVAETVADVAAWLEAGGEAELDDWRAEHRPPLMSARAGGCANPTPVLGIRAA